jgi:23S rRNA (adenine2503-C2)-methyltransferase
MTDKIEFLGQSLPQLEQTLERLGQPKFRARQIYKWIYQKEVASFYAMSDLPRELRDTLNQQAQISIPRVLKQKISDDGTRKFLFELADKKKVETVLIPQNNAKKPRYTLCVSSQVGCPIGCGFCATGRSGFFRNLEAAEIVGQVLSSRREVNQRLKAGPEEKLITNVVYMGMGEPLLNYEPVVTSVHLLNDHKGIDIGQRHITISTSGEARGIEKLAEEGLQVTLAVSLHAANDRLRDQLVPMNRKYPLRDLVAALKGYLLKTGRQVTVEYLLLDGVNTAQSDVDDLAALLKFLPVNINLIPYNEVEGTNFRKPSRVKSLRFYQALRRYGLPVTLREEKGADIAAACGQLAVRGI